MSEAAEAFLQSFHAKDPGGSARAFAHGKDESGRSSYQRLAQTIPTIEGNVTVLDLACGDGYLLELLRQQLGPSARLIGVDMSSAEIAAARVRLRSNADLRCERAQATTLVTGSIDVVVSHMALMLMAPLDAVIREIHRILRPGGVLAAVVASDSRPTGAWAQFIEIARELGASPTIRLGDSRMRTVAGIREVFGAGGGWTEIAIEDFELNLDGRWPQVEAYLFATYVSELLEQSLRGPLRRETISRIPALADAQGTIPCRVGMRLVQFRRANVAKSRAALTRS